MVGAARIDSYRFGRQLLLNRNHCFLKHQTGVFLEHDLGSPSEHRLFVHRLRSWRQPPHPKAIAARSINDDDVTLEGLPEKL
jgi:hypothetical protein